MIGNQRSSTGLREIPDLARTQTHDGILVRARCFAVTEESETTRFEIVVEGHGQCAVVNVASEVELAPRLDEAMIGFAAAARVRAGVFSR